MNLELRKIIADKLMEIYVQIFGNPNIDRNVLFEMELIEDLGMDSAMFISLVIEVENSFGIEVPIERLLMTSFHTLNDWKAFILEAGEKSDEDG